MIFMNGVRSFDMLYVQRISPNICVCGIINQHFIMDKSLMDTRRHIPGQESCISIFLLSSKR